MEPSNRRNCNSIFSGPAFSFKNFRRDYDDSDDEYDPRPLPPHRPHNHNRHDSEDDDNEAHNNADDDDDDYGQGRKRRFHSSSSSSQSPFRSCKSSMSPRHSSSEPDLQRAGDRDSDDDNDDDDDDDEGDKDKSRAAEDDDPRRRRYGGRRGRRKIRVNSFSGSRFNLNDDYDDDDNDEVEDGWKVLPVILLEDIFELLSPKQRHTASQVCRPWYSIFYSPRVWETFVFLERTLTYRRFNLYKGYQRELCPRKTQLCLMRVGCFFKRIVVTPISDYYNLYEFLRVLAAFLAYFSYFPMPLLHTFRFTFACESRGMNGVVIIGTGGNILDKVKEVMNNMRQLRHLALNQLLLDVEEVSGLLSAAATHCIDTLQSLEVLNCSKVPIPLCEVTQFRQLLKLKLSVQHLSEELVLLLGGTQLLQLHIVQDAYTCACSPVTGEAWKLFKEMAPGKRVFLEMEGRTKTPLMLQPHAPVKGIVFRTPYHRLGPDLATWALEYYGKGLEFFVQETLPRAHGSRKFSERADESFLRLVRGCPRLHTLVIRERISLATLLLIAGEGRRLRVFVVRQNALLKRCEWPRASQWTEEFWRWLRSSSRNYDVAFKEVPRLLGKRWKPTSDRSFKHLRLPIA